MNAHNLLVKLPVPRVQFFKWSPSGDQLVTFHLYYETKDNPNPGKDFNSESLLYSVEKNRCSR